MATSPWIRCSLGLSMGHLRSGHGTELLSSNALPASRPSNAFPTNLAASPVIATTLAQPHVAKWSLRRRKWLLTSHGMD